MKWTYDWLKDYLDTNATPAEIADTLTRIGLEVEELIETAHPVAARIVECEKHPDSDHLHVLRVDDGTGALRTVVCGAPNVRVGLVSALAVPGCKIGNMEIKSGKIRGVISDGMMCSGRELGINDDHDGIIELDEKVEKLGQIPSSIIHCPLSIFDAGITPNRPDYLAVRGIARDLAAAGIGEFIDRYDNYAGEFKDGARRAVVENYDACPVYYLCEIKNIKMAPSNPKIAARLAAIGINPKNAPIDATNYICYDLGQPMHCFDADEIHGDIIVRNAKRGEKFTDLFGAEHELVETDLVIADAAGILALAGVIGGARGMTTDATKNILLESAYFDPVTVRRTAKRIGISTDASYRYERGIDPTIAPQGILQAVKIITDACGGIAMTPRYVWDEKNPKLTFMSETPDSMKNISGAEWLKIMEPRRIEYTPALFKKKTGIELDAAMQKRILEALGFVVEENNDIWTITPRPARVDVAIPENIVSELIRLYGYDNIVRDENAAKIDFTARAPSVKKQLAAMGYYECMNYGFGDSKKEKILSYKESVRVLNPIIDTFDTARNSLVQSMLDVVAGNDRFRRSNLSLFELAAVFDGPVPGWQHDQLIVVRTGILGGKIGVKHGRDASVYDIRDDLMSLFPGAVAENDDNPPLWAHPYRAGKLILDNKTVAVFAELHPSVAKKFGIKTNVALGLVDDVSSLASYSPWTADAPALDKIELAEFPLITRDFAFIAANNVEPAELAEIARGADDRIIETNVFDIFDLPDGKKSIAFEIVLQPLGNIADAELMEIQNSVIALVEKSCDAKLRT
ncbi:MAG: phenylalanine--tRNA ligase subunit beta [Rickettsiales bacterium]|jgi:phenylalanyl-tRNA synthetase beta chain|nr:phenylalanine--tRNA ligase subunit beta [Rickettsiales bacterium]